MVLLEQDYSLRVCRADQGPPCTVGSWELSDSTPCRQCRVLGETLKDREGETESKVA